jgi:hypothetical protein
MSAAAAGWIIWVKGLIRPEVQKCTELPRNNATSREYPVLSKHEISEKEMRWPLSLLESKYPYVSVTSRGDLD